MNVAIFFFVSCETPYCHFLFNWYCYIDFLANCIDIIRGNFEHCIRKKNQAFPITNGALRALGTSLKMEEFQQVHGRCLSHFNKSMFQ